MTNQIFSDIKILDFTQVISGSYATTLMGDLGAYIAKVEPPVHGDTLRFAGPMQNGESGYFLLNNRNKKSLSIDLKKPEGMEIIKSLIPHFDILTENFKPGVMKSLGLGYEDVRKIKPSIIYVSVSGYGHDNDYSDRAAYDNIVQAETGLAALNGLPDYDKPLRSPLSVSDFTAGIYSAFAMSSALFHRKSTGVGQYIDIAMYDALMSIMDNTFLIYHMNREQIQKDLADNPNQKDQIMKKWGLRSTGNRHPGAAPHSYFKTKDGYVAHMSLTNEMWKKLLDIIGKGNLKEDPRYDDLTKRKELWRDTEQLIEEWSTQHTTEEVLKIFKENRLPCGKVRDIDEVYDDPHNAQRKIFQSVQHAIAGPIEVVNVPLKMSETPTKITAPSPILGEHNYEILSSILGYSREKVDELTHKKILYQKK